ncbi:MAG: sulfatase-like hydrolase/transferase [Bacteroidales bacterium]|jgi:arylsulfatase A-like enzyme|nr:sulfatase-like hydrolase/transferase [Bacteroidales bacterium]
MPTANDIKKLFYPALTLTLAGANPALAGGERPNIVLIIADDCRRSDLGCYGSPDAVTPNIDRLAEQGLKFNHFFQSTAMSSPTRHCLLTGLYPVRSGAYPNHTFIDEGIKTLPHYLKENGYRVALQGKRHIAPLSAFPFEYLDDNEGHVDPAKIEPFIADAKTKNQPFFLYVASHDPHSPWTRGDRSLFDAKKLTLPPTLVDTEETRNKYVNYLAEINQLDGDVGKIDALIEKYGLTDQTVFIFTSEQGHSFPFAKWTCYDAGLQTAFIVRWKGVVKPQSTTDAMCEYVDVTPTIIDIAGGKPPENPDGKSFLKVITGKTGKFKEAVYAIQTSRGIIAGPEYYGIRSIRDARYRYILNLTPEITFRCASTQKNDAVWASWLEKAQTDPFAQQQVQRYRQRPGEELYDVVNDPFQMNNLAGDPKMAKTLQSMRKKLEQWMLQQGDAGQETELKALEHQVKRNENAQHAPLLKALRAHQHAVHIKKGWIRDPYIYLSSDGYYYLTGTTPNPGDPREESDRYNLGLTPASQKIGLKKSIVGHKIRVWRSTNLAEWEYLGEPFSLENGYWKNISPESFADPGGEDKEWLLWAPEIYEADGNWVFIHTSPSPFRDGANLVVVKGGLSSGIYEFPMGDDMRKKHDPSLFRDDDGKWYLTWGNTFIAPLKPQFGGLADHPKRIDPSNRIIGHEGATIRKIGNKYVHFGTAWSTDKARKGSYNLYYCTADSIGGPYGERRFAGRFLGHGTPFQDKEGRWWCTAFFNANVPPLNDKDIQTEDLRETAQTINEQGVTIVPLEVKIMENGDVAVRAKDQRYAIPGPDEVQKF